MKYILFILFCILSSVIEASHTAEKDTLILLANTAYDNQDYGQAATLYLSYIESDSLSLFARERAAIATHRLGDIPAARDLFLSLEKIDSTSKMALSTLASIYDYEKNTPKAIKYYTALTKYYPDNAINYRKLAQQYQQAGLKRFALQFYEEALDLNPRDQFSLKGLSELYLREKQYTITDSLLSIGLAMDSMNISFNLLQAQSKYLQKAYDSTVYYMEKIRGKYDFKPHQNKMLGYSYIQVDSLDDAIHYLNQAINDAGTKEYAHYHLGVAHEKKGNLEYAIHHYNEAVKAGTSDDLDLYHRNVARLYSHEENLKSAIPHYQDAYKYGKDPILLFYLARASDGYYKDKSIAIRYYTKFINSKYNHPEYQEYSGKRKRYLKELQHLQK